MGQRPEPGFEALFVELCERLGFCLSAEDQARLSTIAVTDADDLTRHVLMAEGFDPPELCDRQLRLKVRSVVAKHVQDAPTP